MLCPFDAGFCLRTSSFLLISLLTFSLRDDASDLVIQGSSNAEEGVVLRNFKDPFLGTRFYRLPVFFSPIFPFFLFSLFLFCAVFSLMRQFLHASQYCLFELQTLPCGPFYGGSPLLIPPLYIVAAVGLGEPAIFEASAPRFRSLLIFFEFPPLPSKRRSRMCFHL